MLESLQNWFESAKGTDFQFLAQREYLIVAGIALGLIVLLLLLRMRPARRIRAFKGETGYVEISRHALLELVHSACEQLPEVRKPAIKIKARRKLNLSVRIRVDGSAHLRDTASFLQTHLKDALENNLGVEKLGKIEILVTGIRAAKRPKVDLNQREAAEEAPAPRPVEEKAATPAPTPKPAPAAPKPAEPKIDLNPAPKPVKETAKPAAAPEKPITAPVAPAAQPAKDLGAKPGPSTPLPTKELNKPAPKDAEPEKEDEAVAPESKKADPHFFERKRKKI
tara:strand:- start:882 stop:1724 length:843 start_codon:yes stop_codon:yes gene_type:complete